MTTPAIDLAALQRDYFLSYQNAWITDESQLKIYPKSRRVGITYSTSYRAVRKCMRNKNFKQWVSSRDMGTAKEFIVDYVARWCKLANIAASGLTGEQIEVIDEDKSVTAFVVTFPNGSRIISLSSNPSAFAGKGGDILLDEMDLHKDQGTLYSMASACVMWGGQLEIVSAYDPMGSDESTFAKLVSEAETGGNPMGWALHKTTLQDAVAAGLVEKINTVRANRNPPLPPITREAFIAKEFAKCRTVSQRETQYECKPVSAHGQCAINQQDLNSSREAYDIIRAHLVGDATDGQKIDPSVQEFIDRRPWKGMARVRFALGYDVARTGHLSSIWLDAAEGAGWRLVVLITLEKCKFTSQENLIMAILEDLGAVGAGDATGLGMNVCENLFDSYPNRFLPVNFSATKPELGTLLTETFEKHLQAIPLEPAEIAEDLRGIRKDSSLRTSKMCYSESENRLNPLSHCDMAWSCALAKLAGKKLAGQVASESIGEEYDGGAMLPPHLARQHLGNERTLL
jgi:phage FluMu gp28-like protein